MEDNQEEQKDTSLEIFDEDFVVDEIAQVLVMIARDEIYSQQIDLSESDRHN